MTDGETGGTRSSMKTHASLVTAALISTQLLASGCPSTSSRSAIQSVETDPKYVTIEQQPSTFHANAVLIVQVAGKVLIRWDATTDRLINDPGYPEGLTNACRKSIEGVLAIAQKNQSKVRFSFPLEIESCDDIVMTPVD